MKCFDFPRSFPSLAGQFLRIIPQGFSRSFPTPETVPGHGLTGGEHAAVINRAGRSVDRGNFKVTDGVRAKHTGSAIPHDHAIETVGVSGPSGRYRHHSEMEPPQLVIAGRSGLRSAFRSAKESMSTPCRRVTGMNDASARSMAACLVPPGTLPRARVAANHYPSFVIAGEDSENLSRGDPASLDLGGLVMGLLLYLDEPLEFLSHQAPSTDEARGILEALAAEFGADSADDLCAFACNIIEQLYGVDEAVAAANTAMRIVADH